MQTTSRRHILGGLLTTIATAKTNPTILLRGSWQTENIGDIAHTPGFLRIVEKNSPGTRVILWPAMPLDRGVEPMLRQAFPWLEIAISADDVKSAFARADVFVQGSAASPTAVAQIEEWRAASKKPYGFFGITVTNVGEAASAAVTPRTKAVLDGAAFLFTRETRSLTNVQGLGVTAQDVRFIPDATFSMDLRDQARAVEYLRSVQLPERKFVCLVPRLRYTPYWMFRQVATPPAEIERRKKHNAEKWAADSAKLLRIIGRAVDAKLKVLLCAEMTYMLELLAPLLAALPVDVRRSVVVRDRYWLPNEAASVYARALAVISCECHSPILAMVQGTSSVYLHQPEDGIKGQMWRDLGWGKGYFEIEEITGDEIPFELPPAAGAVSRAQTLHAQGFAVIRAML